MKDNISKRVTRSARRDFISQANEGLESFIKYIEGEKSKEGFNPMYFIGILDGIEATEVQNYEEIKKYLDQEQELFFSNLSQSSSLTDGQASLVDNDEREISTNLSPRGVSPEEKTKPRTSDSRTSSASTIADPFLNNLLLLSISPEKQEGRIKILFSRERANTIMGQKQGDHVTSHRIFIELLNNKLKNATISNIPDIILGTQWIGLFLLFQKRMSRKIILFLG